MGLAGFIIFAACALIGVFGGLPLAEPLNYFTLVTNLAVGLAALIHDDLGDLKQAIKAKQLAGSTGA